MALLILDKGNNSDLIYNGLDAFLPLVGIVSNSKPNSNNPASNCPRVEEVVIRGHRNNNRPELRHLHNDEPSLRWVAARRTSLRRTNR